MNIEKVSPWVKNPRTKISDQVNVLPASGK